MIHKVKYLVNFTQVRALSILQFSFKSGSIFTFIYVHHKAIHKSTILGFSSKNIDV